MKKQITDVMAGTTHCAKCNEKISLIAGNFPLLTLAWFDPYCTTHYYMRKEHKGAYVCKKCLSKQRAKEIEILEKCQNEVKKELESFAK